MIRTPWRSHEAQTDLFARELAAAVDAKAAYYPAHGELTSYLAHAIAVELDWDRDRTDRVEVAALLHDVGKVMVPASILNKPGSLDDQEWTLMQLHPVWSADIVSHFENGDFCTPWVRAHHERWDGRGYPDGLAGEAIPIQARIIAVADAYASMTTDRAYREAMSRGAAIDELRRHSGTQFDAAIVEAFVGDGLARHVRV